MSDEEKSVFETISLNDGHSEKPLAMSGDDGDNEPLAPAPLQWMGVGKTLLVDTTMTITFNVPQSDGSHQVQMDYHHAEGSAKTVINRLWYQGQQWQHVTISNLAESNTARFDAVWWYKGERSPWSSQQLVVRRAAAFDAANVVVGRVTGTARQGSVIKLVRPNVGTELSETVTVGTSERWSVNLLSSVAQGAQDFLIREDLAGTTGRYTQTKTLTVLKGPSITAPVTTPPTADQRPVIWGRGAQPGAKIFVHVSNSGPQVVVDAAVNGDGTWSSPSIHTFALGGHHSISARQVLEGVYSEWGGNHPFYLVGPPVITTPGSLHTVEMTSTFEGTAPVRHWQNSVNLHSETTSTHLGSASVNYETGRWSRSVTLTPGPHSIVGTHTYLGVTSVGSTPFTLLVRPPKPTLLSRLKGEGVELYGTGYNGVGVRMDIHQPGFGTFYFDAPVNSGNWTKDIPETFVPGGYALSGRQSVSDGVSGRIFNSGWADNLSVNVPTPVPTGMTAIVNGQMATFSGRGRQWGTHEVVVVIFNNGVDLRPTVPAAPVRTNLSWTTTANAELAPGVYTNLTARQWVNNQWSTDSDKFSMTVASPPPELSEPRSDVPSGQRPQIFGRAWPGSTIVLKIPDKLDETLTATGGTFTLDAAEDWAPATYTLTATAAFGDGQPSSPRTRTFTVKAPVPIITTADNAEVDLVPVIEGTGFPGCWVVIYSSTHQELGGGPVGEDKEWTAELAERAPGNLIIYAIQKETRSSANISDATANRTVKVRVPKPGITVPAPNGRPARTSKFTGTTTASQGTVELSIKGENQPFITDIPLKPDGSWEETLTLSVGGPKIVEARLRQKTYLSDPFERVVTVVPNVPVIDTPGDGEALGRLLRISGFGYPEDTVHVQRTGNAYNFEPVTVKEDGTWSANFVHNMIATNGIKVFARAGAGLDSLASSTSTFLLLGPAPQITEPLPGDWVGIRPLYSGLATPGASITVASWFNAEDVLAPATVADDDGRWAVVGNKDLPVGAARVIMRQTVDGKASEWAESGRFMVERKTAQFEAPTVHFPLVGQEVGRRPMFSGTGEPGAEIFICKVNDMSTVLATTRVDRNGKWAVRSQIELPVAESAYTYSVRQSRDDVVSKWLLPNRTAKVIQMPAAFEKPIIDLPVNDAAQELECRPVFAGRGMPGAELKVYRHSTTTVLATTRVDAQGNWSVRCAVELAVQTNAHQIAAQQNMDGQLSAWSGIAMNFKVAENIDRPVIVSPVADAQISPREVIRGTAMPGVEVRLYRSGNPNVVWGKGVADALGQWVIVTGGLPLGDFRMAGKGYKDTLQSPWMLERDFTVIDAG